jgi:hypothetical protein
LAKNATIWRNSAKNATKVQRFGEKRNDLAKFGDKRNDSAKKATKSNDSAKKATKSNDSAKKATILKVQHDSPKKHKSATIRRQTQRKCNDSAKKQRLADFATKVQIEHDLLKIEQRATFLNLKLFALDRLEIEQSGSKLSMTSGRSSTIHGSRFAKFYDSYGGRRLPDVRFP